MKTFIFDFDGTIANSFPLACDIASKELSKLGFNNLSPEEIHATKNMSTREFLKYIKVPTWKTPRFLSSIRKLSEEKKDEIDIFPEWVDTLEQLKGNQNTLGILSSNSEKTIRFVLKKYEILDLFDFIISDISLFGKSKSLKKIIKKMKLNHNNTYFIGDEVRDIEAAHTNQIRPIAVTWGFNSKEKLKSAKPDCLITHPNEIRSILL